MIRDEQGHTTVELAIGLLSLLVVSTAGLWLVMTMVLQLRLVDSAAEIARQEARGDGAAVAAAEQRMPAGARVERQRRDGMATVTVRLDARPLGPRLPAVPLEADARVVLEPGER